MTDTPREIQLVPGSDASPPAGAGLERLGADLGNVLSSLQNTVDQMRTAAQAEISRMRTEHEAERSRLQEEIAQLQTRCSGQDERLRGLQSQLASVLEDYRGELEMQTQRAEPARAQLDRVRQIIGALDSAGSETDGVPSAHTFASLHGGTRDVPYQAQRRGRVVDSWQNDSATDQAGDNTVQIKPATGTGTGTTTKISIRGISSVSAMMRARKAVESLPSINDVESRYVSDGILYFSVRSEDDSQALAKALTSLPDPNLRLLQVSGDSIELEM